MFSQNGVVRGDGETLLFNLGPNFSCNILTEGATVSKLERQHHFKGARPIYNFSWVEFAMVISLWQSFTEFTSSTTLLVKVNQK